MDINQLKALAERLKTFLSGKGHVIKHGHALEFVAAIPGLRSWAEVTSFPDRVAAATVNEHSARRLCARLGTKLQIHIGTDELLEVLGTALSRSSTLLSIWPDGAEPGLYVTTEEHAVARALERFAAAAPGALMFCEQAGAHAELAIDLGDYGVFSPGLRKAPRGSLVVLGPLEFVEESWDDLGDRLRCAAKLALEAGHRIVVLAKTPCERTLHFDVSRLVRWEDSPPEYVDEMLRGIVTQDGRLVRVDPFAGEPPLPRQFTPQPKTTFPEPLADFLRSALAFRDTGIVGICSGLSRDRYELMEAALPLIARGRAAARIQPDFRGGYGGEPPLSSSFVGMEVCASIEAAHALGYRVMVIEKAFGRELFERLLQHSDEVCFLVAGFGSVATAFAQMMIFDRDAADRAIASAIALLSVADVKSTTGAYPVYDVYSARAGLPQISNDEDAYLYGERNRVVRWEDQVSPLLKSGRVTREEIEESLRGYMISDFWKSEGPATALDRAG